MLDLVIHGGTIIDGTGSPRCKGDVGVRGGHLAAIGDLRDCDAKQRIDAANRVVAPGFIDCHTHDDAALIANPLMLAKISQGVTTVVTGNCGISLAPLRARVDAPMPLALLTGSTPRPDFLFSCFASYLERLAAHPASVNSAALVGHTTLRLNAMTQVDRPATQAEIEDMANMLEEALTAGAFGVSTGTFYPPAAHATADEIVAACKCLVGSNGVFTTHMRCEADACVESLEETFDIGRRLDILAVVSHHKLQRQANFGKSAITLPLIAQAMTDGKVSLDCYPYSASSTMLHLDESRLQGRIVIASSEPHPEMVGRELGDVATEWRIGRAQAAERLHPASAIYFSMDEADVRAILAFPGTMVGSDGLPGAPAPHPRLWGTFPRVLGHYARDLALFDLETAVRKMTGLTAHNFGLQDRGVIAVGMAADIVVFDPDTVIDRADYEDPTAQSQGIDVVVVNGDVTFQGGEHLGTRSGQVLRRQVGPPRQSAAR